VPLRIAVVQDGVTPKTIFTKAYQTNVSMSADSSVVFSLVAEDVAIRRRSERPAILTCSISALIRRP